MKALDLFCGAGGASRGLQFAGFDVTGVDLAPQPRYAGDVFIQASALRPPIDLAAFDLIWASPPCQPHTSLRSMHNAKPHLDLIGATRDMLRKTGVPYVIENVPGAPLHDPITLCGSMFGLGCMGAELRRHRLFETSFPVRPPSCRHHSIPVIGIYGGHARNRRRSQGDRGVADFTMEQAHAAMGIDWMTLAELSQAIPPAYAEFLGHIAFNRTKEAA